MTTISYSCHRNDRTIVLLYHIAAIGTIVKLRLYHIVAIGTIVKSVGLNHIAAIGTFVKSVGK